MGKLQVDNHKVPTAMYVQRYQLPSAFMERSKARFHSTRAVQSFAEE